MQTLAPFVRRLQPLVGSLSLDIPHDDCGVLEFTIHVVGYEEWTYSEICARDYRFNCEVALTVTGNLNHGKSLETLAQFKVRVGRHKKKILNVSCNVETERG